MTLNASHSPHSRLKTLPPVEFYARIKGAAEWVCPKCGRFSRAAIVNWRRPWAACRVRYCHRVFGFGVFASDKNPEVLGDLTPRNARYDQAALNRQTVNHLGSLGPLFEDAIGQILGPVEWWCPVQGCGHRNVGNPDLRSGRVVCKKCLAGWNLALLLFRVLPGAHQVTPIDWIPPAQERTHDNAQEGA